MIQRHGWTLLFHTCLIDQLQKLDDAVQRAKKKDPERYQSNANVKLFNALSHLIMDVVPLDPHQEEYRQGHTMGAAFKHWRRAKIGRRFRLFFRFDSKSKVIIFAWINDLDSFRSSGSKTDPYTVFQKMLEQGHPPHDWASLMATSQEGFDSFKKV